jgi:hypothetical protein
MVSLLGVEIGIKFIAATHSQCRLADVCRAQHFEYDHDIAGVEINIPAAKAIPLDLNPSELVTNAPKYAKGNRRRHLQCLPE